MEFKKGDRVMVRPNYHEDLTGKIGEVISVERCPLALSSLKVGVQFDFERSYLHSCGGLGAPNRCHVSHRSFLEKVADKESSKADRHMEICKELNETYRAKNADYGDSFAELRKDFPEAIIIRAGDKYNRLKQLMLSGKEAEVSESIEDTLLDLANYCIMEVIEMRNDG